MGVITYPCWYYSQSTLLKTSLFYGFFVQWRNSIPWFEPSFIMVVLCHMIFESGMETISQ